MHEAQEFASNTWEDEATRLRQIRHSLGLTVERVARGASLDRSTISAYETLRSRPHPHALRAWQAALAQLARERRLSSESALRELGLTLAPML